jgi:uncharacterized protein YbjT (DUF2867 family)
MSPTKKLLVVFGATGQQGGAIINHVLSSPNLSSKYTLRGVTRDPSSAAAQALIARKVEVVPGDADKPESLAPALAGADFVFVLTAPTFGPSGKEDEVAQGKALIDGAVAAGAEYVIHSTIPHISVLSGGKYTNVPHFDAKGELENYLRDLSKKGVIRSAFFSPGSYMQNYHTWFGPRKAKGKEDEWEMINVGDASTKVPLLDIEDAGKWVGAILADPAKYEGRHIAAAQKLYPYSEVVAAVSKAAGKKVSHRKVSDEEFKEAFGDVLGEPILDVFSFVRDFGYYGPGTEKQVQEGIEIAETQGTLGTLEEYFQRVPVGLE